MNLPDDPYVRELLPEFVDTWIQDIENDFKPLLEAKNGTELYRMAHTLKGSCFQFGLDNIAELGIELMGYAKNEEWDKAEGMETKIRKAFIDVRDYLKENPDK